MKYALDGSALWARTILSGPTMAAAKYNALAVNSSGDVFAAGFIQGTPPVDFGGVSATAIVGGDTAVLVKYDSSGTALSATTPIFPAVPTLFNAITIDASNNIIVAGSQYSTSTVFYGGNVFISGGIMNNDNTLVVKYDGSGAPLWGRTTLSGPSYINQARGIAVDPMTGGYLRGRLSKRYGPL